MTTGVCDFEGGCQAPVLHCAVCPEPPLTNYNILFLAGQHHVTDEIYQRIIKEDYDVEIPDEFLYTHRVNEYYVSLNPEDNIPYLNKKLAENGLYEEDTNE